jgi:hypothetical protein
MVVTTTIIIYYYDIMVSNLVGSFNPSEKYESQLEYFYSQHMEKSNSCSKPPTSNTDTTVVDISHYYSYPSAAQVTNSDFNGPSCGSPTASVTDSVGALLRGSRRSRSTWDFFVLVKPEMNGLMIDFI